MSLDLICLAITFFYSAPKRKPKLNEDGEEIVEECLPAGTVALFLSSKSQEIFSCVCDENITEDEPFILLSKAKIRQDLFDRAAVSDFSPFKVVINVNTILSNIFLIVFMLTLYYVVHE